MKRLKSLVVLLCLLHGVASADPLPGMGEPLDAREYVFGPAIGALPGHPGFLPGAGALTATFDEERRVGLALLMPDLDGDANRQQLTYVAPVSDSLRLGTLAVEARRADSGVWSTGDGDFRDVSFSLGLGWSIGLGTRVILNEGEAASAEELIQRALEGHDPDHGDDIEDYVEEPGDWLDQPPEFRTGYYLGLGLRYFSRETLPEDDHGTPAGSQGFGLDLSVAVPLVWRRLYLGLGLTNLFQPNLEAADGRELAPRRLKASLGFVWSGLSLAAGAETDLDGNLGFAVAGEYIFFQTLSLRLAYHGDAPRRADYAAELRGGLGARFGSFGLDLAAGFSLDDGPLTVSASLGVYL